MRDELLQKRMDLVDYTLYKLDPDSEEYRKVLEEVKKLDKELNGTV